MNRELLDYLKTVPHGDEAREALKKRTLLQIEDWKSDPMVARVMEQAKGIKASEVLDVGCHTGWLYHYLRPERYTGIDIWPEAISVAQESFPEGRFLCMDVLDFHERVEFVWCAQVGFGDRIVEVMKHLRSIGKHGLTLLLWHEAERFNEGKLERSGPLVTVRW
jgi:predicted RNA methylase